MKLNQKNKLWEYFLLLFLVLFYKCVKADVVRPGDTGSILLPIENNETSVGSMEGVEAFANVAEPFNSDIIISSITCSIDGESVPIPANIPVGKTAMFNVRYEYKYDNYIPDPYQMPLITISGAIASRNCVPNYIQPNNCTLNIARSVCLIAVEQSSYSHDKYLAGPIKFSVPGIGNTTGITVIAEADIGNGFFEVGRATSPPYEIIWDTNIYPECTKVKVRSKVVIEGGESILAVFRSLGGRKTELFESEPGMSKEIEIDNKRTILQYLKVSNTNQIFYEGKWETSQGSTYNFGVNSSDPLIPGIYNIAMTFTDSVNNATIGFSKLIPPEANFNWKPESIEVMERVTFGVTSVIGGKKPYTFKWNFGDGTTAEGLIVEHTYYIDGSYTVVLDTQDALGRNFRKTAQIYVAPSKAHRAHREPGDIKEKVHGGTQHDAQLPPSPPSLEGVTFSSLTSEDGGITWIGQIEVKEGIQGRVYLVVSAIEQNKNPIEALTYKTPVYQSPKRQENGMWNPPAIYGTDASHTIVIVEEGASSESEIVLINNGDITPSQEQINYPSAATNLQSQLLKELKVVLSWQGSNGTQVKYNIYSNNGNGEIDYTTKLVQAQSPATSVELGPLTEAMYKFAIRVEGSQANEEKNENFIQVQVRYLGEASAKIVIPQVNKKVNGNSLVIVSENSSNTKGVEYYYRATNEASWHLIEKQEGINIAYWDTTNLEQKGYELKAIAKDARGNPDETPESIMLVVEKTDPDVEENTVGDKKIKMQKIEQNKENTIELVDGTGANIPENEGGSKIKIETLSNDELLTKLPVSESSLKPTGIFRKFEFTDGKNNFNKELTISIPYTDSNNDGIIDGTDITANEALVYYLKEETGEWIKVGKEETNSFKSSLASFVSVSSNKITAKTKHFTIFGIFKKAPATNLDNIIVYPNPYKPSVVMQGGTGIKFDGLTANMRLRIYTISGRLVKEIESSTDGSYEWDCTNNEGERVASGVYVYIVTNGNEIKKGKLAIIK